MHDSIEWKLLGPGDEGVLEGARDGVFDRAVEPGLAALFLSDPRHHIAVATESSAVVGFASAVSYIHPDKPARLWINEVAVAEGYRRRGIGERLLRLLLQHGRALGCEEAWVLTDEANGSANQLYLKLGGAPEKQVLYCFAGKTLAAP